MHFQLSSKIPGNTNNEWCSIDKTLIVILPLIKCNTALLLPPAFSQLQISSSWLLLCVFSQLLYAPPIPFLLSPFSPPSSMPFSSSKTLLRLQLVVYDSQTVTYYQIVSAHLMGSALHSSLTLISELQSAHETCEESGQDNVQIP